MKKTNAIGLYIHIPFCVKKCNYCDFLSMPVSDDVMSRYIQALKKEIKECTYFKNNIVDTIFVGGGTPSILKESLTDDFFSAIYKYANISENAEITMECNPGTLNKMKCRGYEKLGINRLSIGVQSTVKEELAALGRIHTYEDFLRSYDFAREAGIQNINVDLMSGIPLQTLSSYELTLNRILKLKPEHISAYSLIVEEGTPFYQLYEKEPPVSEETDRNMYELTKELLAFHGYNRYEISNYSSQGFECKHNIKYWQRDEYVGLGLGASSYIEETRMKNVSELETYLDHPLSEKEEVEKLSREDAMSEFMFLGLRMTDGVSENQFQKEFGKSIYEVFEGVTEKHLLNGLLTKKNDRIFLTEQGMNLANTVFIDFLL